MDVITLDLETEGLDWTKDKILLTGYKVNEKDLLQMDGSPDRETSPLARCLKLNTTILRGHNVKFDALFLAQAGFEINCQFEDTRVLAYLNWPEADSHSLKELVRTKLRGSPTELSDIQFKPLKRDELHLDERDYYKFSDGRLCRRDLLRTYHRDDINNVDRLRSILTVPDWFTEVEMPLTRMLFEMELYGAPIDGNKLSELRLSFGNISKECLDKIIRLRGPIQAQEEAFNPNSSEQVRDALKARGYKLNEICEKTDKGAFKVDKPLLKSLSHGGDEFCATLLDYRKYSKLLSTYILPFTEGIKKDGRLHGSINQAGSEDQYGDGKKGTKTGRLASSDPNLQNIPSRTKQGKEVRSAFIASAGMHMFDTDLSQIEPRLVAHYSQAPKLLDAYANGRDTHGLFADEIFGKSCGKESIERFIGKSSWLATVYGCSFRKLLYICEGFSDNPLELDTAPYKEAFDHLDKTAQAKVIKECGKDYRKIYEQWMFFKNVQDRFQEKNPDIFGWRETHIARTRRLGYVITIGGRRIAVDGLNSKDWGIKYAAERRAVNFLVQGSAADIMKMIMIRAQNEIVRPGKGRIFAVVHDELLGELKDKADVALVKDIMENTCNLRNVKIQADCKLINNWSEK